MLGMALKHKAPLISRSFALYCAPTGVRTPVSALRGPRPGPLDDGGSGVDSTMRVFLPSTETSMVEAMHSWRGHMITMILSAECFAPTNKNSFPVPML